MKESEEFFNTFYTEAKAWYRQQERGDYIGYGEVTCTIGDKKITLYGTKEQKTKLGKWLQSVKKEM